MEETILKVVRLKKYFRGPASLLGRKALWLKAVDGVSFQVKKGETFGLVGESGCGKSTLGKTILGIYRPTSGSVFFEGKEITSLNRREAKKIRKDIQYVYQDPGISLDPYWKIKGLLSEPLLIHTSLSRKAIEKRIGQLMDSVGLTKEQLSLYPHEFSGGQQRRLGLARILSLNPSLVILDEPTSGLDVSVQATILKLFLELKRQFDLTYIFISHDLSVVRMMCQIVAVMYAGRIVEMGETRMIFADPLHPYTQVLLSAIPAIGKKQRAELPLVGEPPDPLNFPDGCRFWPRCKHKREICSRKEPTTCILKEGRAVSCHLLGSNVSEIV